MRMSSPSTKKRRVCKSFEEKCAIITFVEENPSLKQKEIAEKYGIKPQTLSDILKNKDDFKMKAANSKFTQHLTKDRKLKYEEVDKALILWFRDRTSVPGVIIDGEVLRAKANEFAKLLYGGSTPHDAVKATWVDRFKKRYGIGKVTMSGDAAGVDPKNVDTWKNVELPQILHDYAPCDIYNFDETALFWKASPDKGLGFICTGSHHGVKQGKSRITILLGANMDGSDKPLPFVIGKFKNPRAFKNIRQLPVTYKSNCKAWMTATLFIEFMQKLNKHFRNQGRHVAVILDNCCAHRADELQQLTHVKIFFLPPNTTSVTQPMDAGIIKNFKVHYRRRLCIKRLYCIDTKTEYTWSLLDAVLACRAAWNAVTPTTISNCFGHVGFIQSIDAGTTAPESLEIEACGSGDSVMEIDPAFDNIWERLQQYFQLKGITFNNYVAIDEDACASEPLTEKDIVDLIQENENPEVDEPDDESVTTTATPSVADCLRSVDTLRRYFLACNSNSSELDVLQHLEDRIHKEQFANQIQSKITDFFTVKSN